MRVVIAPDAFKESLTAPAVAEAIASGIRKAFSGIQLELVPMADGGPGTVRALVEAAGGEYRTATVEGPMGERVNARFGLKGGGEAAVVEMAAAAGLELVPADQRDPLCATTFGVGELLLAAADSGARYIVLGIGGSATNDGGAGLAQALGFRLLDAEGRDLPRGGGALRALDRILPPDRPPLERVRIDVACDVSNPLTGPEGASAVFGPQKGATPELVEVLDRGLSRLAAVVRRDLGIEMETVPGAGAAGGLGGGLVAFANASLKRGVELVAQAAGLERRLRGADLCITGEGSIDAQSRFGKTVSGVARIAKELGVPVLVLAGSVRGDWAGLQDLGVTAVLGVTPRPMPLAEALENARENLECAAEQAMRLFLAGARRAITN